MLQSTLQTKDDVTKIKSDVHNYTRYLRYGSLLARKSTVLRVTSNQTLIENTALEEDGFSLFQSCSILASN